MKRTKLLLILGILALTAVVFTGCKEADDSKSKGGYVPVKSLTIDGLPFNSISNTQTATLTAAANKGAHKSLKIEWEVNNTAIRFVVDSVEASTADGTAVQIRGKAVYEATQVTITAKATTTNPSNDETTMITAEKTITVTPVQKPSAEWLFPLSMAETEGLVNNGLNQYPITKEITHDTKTLEGIDIGLIIVSNSSTQFRSGQGKNGYLQVTSSNASFAKLTGIPAGVKVAITFEFTDTNDNADASDTGRYPTVIVGGGTPIRCKNNLYASTQIWLFDTAEVTADGGDIILAVNTGIRVYSVKVEILETPALTALQLNAGHSQFRIGQETTLEVIRTPAGAVMETIEWVFDTNFFEITEDNGDEIIIKGKAATDGPKEIKVQSAINPSVSNSVNITVTALTGNEKLVQSVAINEEDFELKLPSDATKQLTTTVLPLDADDDELHWTATPPGVVTVSHGLVTAVGKGTATITAAAMDGSGISDTVTVTVKQLVTGINIGAATDKFWLNFDGTQGGTGSITIDERLISVLPANADVATYTWSSEETDVVSINQDRVVTATGIGKTKIRATATDGSGTFGTIDVEVINFAATYGAPDVQWKFDTAMTISADNTPYVVGGVTMNLNGAARGGMVVDTAQAAYGGLGTTGSLNAGGASASANYVVIKSLQGPFTLVVLYNAGGANNSGRSLNIYTGTNLTSGNTGTLQVTGASAFGSAFGQNPALIEYKYEGFDTVDVGFRMISNAVRVHDVYLYYPTSTAVFALANDNKHTITAGNSSSGAAPDTLQFKAMQNRQDVTSTTTWSISSSSTINAGNTTIAGIASISTGGLLTAASDLDDDKEIWVFASNSGVDSEGYKVTIDKWVEAPTGPALISVKVGGATGTTSYNPATGELTITGTGVFTNSGSTRNMHLVYLSTPLSNPKAFEVEVDLVYQGSSFGGTNNDARIGIIVLGRDPSTFAVNQTPYALLAHRANLTTAPYRSSVATVTSENNSGSSVGSAPGSATWVKLKISKAAGGNSVTYTTAYSTASGGGSGSGGNDYLHITATSAYVGLVVSSQNATASSAVFKNLKVNGVDIDLSNVIPGTTP